MGDSSSLADFFSGPRSSHLLEELDAAQIPAHVAIIMDGNGRWAKSRSLPRLAGHRAGAKAVREAIATAIELDIEYLTIYSFSSENWNRSSDEISGLMALFVEVLEKELSELERLNVRVRVIGTLDEVPAKTRDAFVRCVNRTSRNSGLTLVVALNYGGRDDLVRACRQLASDVSAGHLDPSTIDDAVLTERLSTSGLPDPDLVIRTSGEMRVSNFLLWEIAYSELWVTPTLWPDFSRFDLLEAVVDFQRRERRFGGAE